MKPEEKELVKLKDSIKDELRDIFEKNLKVFDLDIPEADDLVASKLIVSTMQMALDELKDDINSGKYSNY